MFKNKMAQDKVKIDDKTVKLFIGGINPAWSTDYIKNFLAKYGAVKRVDIVKHFAFAFAEDQDAAEKIIDGVSGKSIENYSLVVQISKNKQNLPDSEDCCFECGKIGHWAKECKQRSERYARSSYGGSSYGGSGNDRHAAPSRSYDRGYDRDPYARSAYSRDSYSRDPYARDPYGYPPARPYERYDYRERSPPYRGSISARCDAVDPYAEERCRLAYGGSSSSRSSYPSRDPYGGR